jgi:hypothetical protein
LHDWLNVSIHNSHHHSVTMKEEIHENCILLATFSSPGLSFSEHLSQSIFS